MTDAEPESPPTETKEEPLPIDEPVPLTDVPMSVKDKIIGGLASVFILLVIGFFAYVEISDFLRYSRNEVPRWNISSSYRRYAANQVLLNAAKTGDQNVIDAVRTGLYNGRIP